MDAHRIAKLFATFGIDNMAYLRAFSRLSSRDEWLREMRNSGQLSEIQMRILSEMLSRVGKE